MAGVCLLLIATAAGADDQDEFRVKREAVFAFTEKPTVVRGDNQFVITFASQAYCDVSVVVENGDGRIVRHLAAGVLGENAPEPLQPHSLRQRIVWDGKDDRGAYLDPVAGHRVRVSLGLQPQYEKTLLWEPRLRMHQDTPGMAASPEGVYVYDGRVLDHVRLFSHEGEYVRTIYPFPADQVDKVQGLHWRPFPEDGAPQPLKEGFHQATLLSSGQNAGFDARLGIGIDAHNNDHGAVWGNAASMLAVRGKRLALGRLKLNRLATDGSSGGLDIHGPDIAFPISPQGNYRKTEPIPVPPRSAAFSPDGKTLYLTGYVHGHGSAASRDIVLINFYDWLPGVTRIDFANGAAAETFLGGMQIEDAGDDNQHFAAPSSVDVDPQGRIYVSDYANDRIQVYAPDGSHLKTIPSQRPAQVAVDQQTGQIYVFHWWLPQGKTNGGRPPTTGASVKKEQLGAFNQLSVLKSFDDPVETARYPLTLQAPPSRGSGYSYRAVYDSWAKSPTFWITSEWGRSDFLSRDKSPDASANLQLFQLQGDKVVLLRDFNEDARRQVQRVAWPEYSRQRLHVDPVRGHLYVAEGQSAVGKSTYTLLRVDPETEQVENVPLPFDAEDICFDSEGLAYLRSFYYVVRYDPVTWRETPWDYGEEHADLRTSSSRRGKTQATAQSVLRLPVEAAGLHHHGGMGVSPRGHLAVAVNNHVETEVSRKDIDDVAENVGGNAYVPPAWPGRVRYGEVHVFDRHGQLLHQDALPGAVQLDGIQIDRNDDLYALSSTTRILDGKPYFNDMTETLVKIKPGAGRFIGDSDKAVLPLSPERKPARPAELFNGLLGKGWLEGAEWFYGGLGFAGKNAGRSGGGCNCYNSRFALDYLGRSFAPSVGHHSVAVLDSNGNLILRIGRYGNVDSAGPDSQVPLGGDEVGLFYAPYVAVHTDRRLFIADPGNARIVSVRLDYHATEQVALEGE
ncbi:NHL repeat protein [Lignipirellula cremea]|uniref:NHL repeat protein n=2 Tax=Lignipirellula cremea TaxID=2528010 RepID=A0A518E0G4_9BACT|nr:NHL repeat protein [Lignipirellula cremea]